MYIYTVEKIDYDLQSMELISRSFEECQNLVDLIIKKEIRYLEKEKRYLDKRFNLAFDKVKTGIMSDTIVYKYWLYSREFGYNVIIKEYNI